MAEIRVFPFVRHLRASAASHVVHYRRTAVRHSARGAAFWFDPLVDSLAEVPLDDREVALMVHGRSLDYQDVSAQGMIAYRFADPLLVAQRYDFTIDSRTGELTGLPLEQIEAMVAGRAEQHVQAYLARTDLRDALLDGVERSRDAVERGLAGDATLAESGIAIVSVQIKAVKPSADLEKAIEAPTRERIKQNADEAAFGRRALAVEKERAIAENELQNRIELARREEHLISQTGENERNKALHAAEAQRIAAATEAETVSLVEGARLAVERQKIEAYAIVPPAVMLGLAAREFAGKIDAIGQVTLTPDLVGPFLANVLRPQR